MDQIPVILPNQEWGMDMSYLTPANMANFRPAYKERLKNKARELGTESKTVREGNGFTKESAIKIAKGNDGKHQKGEAKKFLDNAQDLKNDGKLNSNDSDKNDKMKGGKLTKKAFEIARRV